MKSALLPLALSALALAGCGSTVQATQATSASPTPTSPPTSYYGESAAAIAARISGCEGVKAGDVAQGGPDLSSLASCTLGGRRVAVYSWSSLAAEESVVNVLNANKQELYYAQGTGWIAFVDADGTLGYQLTNQAGELMKYTFAHQGETHAAADLQGEKGAAATVASALGGTVVYQPANT